LKNNYRAVYRGEEELDFEMQPDKLLDAT